MMRAGFKEPVPEKVLAFAGISEKGFKLWPFHTNANAGAREEDGIKVVVFSDEAAMKRGMEQIARSGAKEEIKAQGMVAGCVELDFMEAARLAYRQGATELGLDPGTGDAHRTFPFVRGKGFG